MGFSPYVKTGYFPNYQDGRVSTTLKTGDFIYLLSYLALVFNSSLVFKWSKFTKFMKNH
jgi:hypothetical protein